MKKNIPIIKSIAVKTPEKYCSNDMPPFSEIQNIPKYWWKLWGIEGRYFSDRNSGESCESLGEEVSLKAIKSAELRVEDIDLILGTTCSVVGWAEDKTKILPGIAEQLKKRLGCKSSTVAIEINQACITFLVSLQIAVNYIKSGAFKNILICTSESFTTQADFSEVSSTLFGDGSVAAVVSNSGKEGSGFLSSFYLSESAHNEIATLQWRYPNKDKSKLQAEELRSYFSLDENAPSKMQTFVPKNVPLVINKALDKLQLTSQDIDYYIFHQPSETLINMWAKGLNISKEKYLMTVNKYSCLGSASIPLTLNKAVKQKKVFPGNKIVLAGASIGWGFGAQVWNIETINCE